MNDKEFVNLKSIIEKPVSGEWGDNDETGNGIYVLRTTNFTNDGIIDFNNTVKRQITKKNIENKFLKHGDILIEKSGGSDYQPVGRVVYFEEQSDKYLFNNFTALLRVSDNTKWNPKYIFYLLFAKYKHGRTVPYDNRTTGIHNLRLNQYLESIDVTYIDLFEQQKIVAKLDNLNLAIDKCKRLLELHDELIKSKFYEMFGDIISNSKSWNIYLLKDISDSRLGKMLDSKQNLKESSKPYLANFNVQWFKFDLNKLNEMDFDDNEQKEFRLKHGDLLVTEGGEVGRCAIWNNEMNECYFQKALHRVRCNLSLVLPIYLAWWFKFRSDFNKFEDIVGGVTTIAHLTGIKLKSLQIPLPPLQLQTQFAQYVETVESSKTKIKELQSRIEYLKASYMQEYFA